MFCQKTRAHKRSVARLKAMYIAGLRLQGKADVLGGLSDYINGQAVEAALDLIESTFFHDKAVEEEDGHSLDGVLDFAIADVHDDADVRDLEMTDEELAWCRAYSSVIIGDDRVPEIWEDED